MTSLLLLAKKAFHTGNYTASKKRCTQSGRLHTHCLTCTQSRDHSHGTALPALTSSLGCSPLPICCHPCMDVEKLLPDGDFTPLDRRKGAGGGKYKRGESRRVDCLWLFFSLLPRMRQRIKRQTSKQIPSSRETFGW